jgi:hypothetical protein
MFETIAIMHNLSEAHGDEVNRLTLAHMSCCTGEPSAMVVITRFRLF